MAFLFRSMKYLKSHSLCCSSVCVFDEKQENYRNLKKKKTTVKINVERCQPITIWQKMILLERVERMINWKVMLSRQAGVVNRGLRSLGWGRLEFFSIPRTITASCGE